MTSFPPYTRRRSSLPIRRNAANWSKKRLPKEFKPRRTQRISRLHSFVLLRVLCSLCLFHARKLFLINALYALDRIDLLRRLFLVSALRRRSAQSPPVNWPAALEPAALASAIADPPHWQSQNRAASEPEPLDYRISPEKNQRC